MLKGDEEEDTTTSLRYTFGAKHSKKCPRKSKEEPISAYNLEKIALNPTSGPVNYSWHINTARDDKQYLKLETKEN